VIRADNNLLYTQRAGTLLREQHYLGDTSREIPMTLLIIIILVVLLLGGGGFGYSRYGAGGAGGIVGTILIIVLILWLLGVLHPG
jgi:hypothetical protein